MSRLAAFRPIVRSLGRNPGFLVLATLLLAVGMGLTLYMFGAIDGFVLRPLPYRDSARLMHFELSDPEQGRSSIEVPISDYYAFRGGLKSFEDFAAFYSGTISIADKGDPERLDGCFVTANLFDVLGVRPALGRDFAAADETAEAPRVALISDTLWKRRFGADPAILGRTVRLNSAATTIVGVMPEGFLFPEREEIWTVLPGTLKSVPWQQAQTAEVLGHLAPGASVAAARSELDVLLTRQAEADPTRPQQLRAVVKPLSREYVPDDTRMMLGLMFVAVVLVLLIACADVANLLLARGMAHQHEVAVRAALGAPRWRLVGERLVEAAAVAVLAAGIGLAGAEWAGARTIDLLKSAEGVSIPSWVHISLDARSIVFTFLVVLATTLLAALGPALANTRPDVLAELRQTGRGNVGSRLGRAGRFLVVAQIALCVALVTSAGLTALSVRQLHRIDVGIAPEKMLGARVALFEASYPDDASRLAFFQRAERELAALPGVTVATVTTSLPASTIPVGRIEIEGQDQGQQSHLLARYAAVSPSYFAAAQMPVLAGRGIEPRDDSTSEAVTVINRRMASTLFKEEDPIGRRIRLVSGESSRPWLRIVGVVPDLQQASILTPLGSTFYVPIAQNAPRFAFLAVRTERDDAHALAPAMRKLVTGIDPDQALYWVRTIGDWIRVRRFLSAFLASLFGAFAIAGLLLAATGVYGVLAYSVVRRTSEIGVRRALGARNSTIIGLIATRSLRDLAWGVGFGALLAAALARPLASWFYGVHAFEPAVALVVPAVLLVATLLAAAAPTLRALRLDPAAALRNE